MKKQRRCQNKECGVLFTPCPQVPRQKYCSQKVCQQGRKNEWDQKKLIANPAYREERQADHEYSWLFLAIDYCENTQKIEVREAIKKNMKCRPFYRSRIDNATYFFAKYASCSRSKRLFQCCTSCRSRAANHPIKWTE